MFPFCFLVCLFVFFAPFSVQLVVQSHCVGDIHFSHCLLFTSCHICSWLITTIAVNAVNVASCVSETPIPIKNCQTMFLSTLPNHTVPCCYSPQLCCNQKGKQSGQPCPDSCSIPQQCISQFLLTVHAIHLDLSLVPSPSCITGKGWQGAEEWCGVSHTSNGAAPTQPT